MEFDSVSSALSDAYDFVKDKASELADKVVETADEAVQSLKEVSVFPNEEERVPNNDGITINSQQEPAPITEAAPVQDVQPHEDEPQAPIEPVQNIPSKQPLNIQEEKTQQRVINELETQCNQLETDFNKSLNSNGWISGAWHHFKNITGVGASSNKTQAEINKLKSQIQKLKKNPAKLSETYKNITGEDLTSDNLNSFLNKEKGNSLYDKTQAGKSLTDYKEGQEMSVDIAADIGAGIVSVGTLALGTAAGICAAPLTGGASLALIGAGLGIAGTAGGVTKSLIKASDCIGNDKEYTRENFKYDFVTGGVNGLAAPLTFGLGGAAGTSIMKLAGMQSLERTVLSEGAKQAGKTGLKETAAKVTANVASKTVDGGLAGGVDATVRDIASGKTENIAEDIQEGIKYGAIGGVALGTAFEQIAKAGKSMGDKIHSLRDNADDDAVIKSGNEPIISDKNTDTVGKTDDNLTLGANSGSIAGDKIGNNLPEKINSDNEAAAVNIFGVEIPSKKEPSSASPVYLDPVKLKFNRNDVKIFNALSDSADDEMIEKYRILYGSRENTIIKHIQTIKQQADLSRDLTPDEAVYLFNENVLIRNYNDFIKLKDSTDFSRPLTNEEALLANECKYDKTMIEHLIKIKDENPELSTDDIFTIIHTNIPDEKISDYLKLRQNMTEEEAAEKILSEQKRMSDNQEERLKRTKKLTQEDAGKYTKFEKLGLNEDEINFCIKNGYTLEHAEMLSCFSSEQRSMMIKNNYSSSDIINYKYIFEHTPSRYGTEYFIKQTQRAELSRNITPDEALFLYSSRIGGDYVHSEEIENFVKIKDCPDLSRTLTNEEAFYAMSHEYREKSQLQHFIEIKEKYPQISEKNLDIAVTRNLNDEQIEKLFVMEEHFQSVELSDNWGNKYSFSKWLDKNGIQYENIDEEAFKFFQKLEPDTVQILADRFQGGTDGYIGCMLQKKEFFKDVDYSKLGKNAEFLNLLVKENTINNNVKMNISFITNSDFDADGATRLLEAFKNTRIKQPNTNEYNFSMLANMNAGYYSLSEILNSKSINFGKTAEFLDKMNSTELNIGGVDWTLADIFKTKKLHECIREGNIDSDKIIQLAEAIKEKHGDSIKADDLDEIEWILTTGSKSPINTADEFMLAYDYLNGRKTPDGDKILTGRKGRIDKSELMSNMLGIDPASVESNNRVMLLSLVEKGIAGKHLFEYIPAKGKINPAVEDDLHKLYQAYDMGITPIDMFVPSFKSADEAIKGKNSLNLEVKQGDVFQVEGEDFIRIKTSDTESEKLNISRDTYFKLFPPIERYGSTQNAIGNCWELTGINSVLCENDTRASVLRLFREEGDDIVINFPNSNYEEIRFKNGELPKTADERFHSQGALGVKMLEYAHGREIQSEWIERAYKKFDNLILNANDESRRDFLQKKLVEFTEFIENNQGNVTLNLSNGIDWDKYNGQYDSIFSENRDGGMASTLYERLGYKDAKSINFYDTYYNYFTGTKTYKTNSNYYKVKDLLKDAKTFNNHVVAWLSKGQGVEQTVKAELGIVSQHEYRIKPAKINDDGTVETFKLINPWGITETELTLDEVLQYGLDIRIAKK